jgi:hypothetical protein
MFMVLVVDEAEPAALAIVVSRDNTRGDRAKGREERLKLLVRSIRVKVLNVDVRELLFCLFEFGFSFLRKVSRWVRTTVTVNFGAYIPSLKRGGRRRPSCRSEAYHSLPRWLSQRPLWSRNGRTHNPWSGRARRLQPCRRGRCRTQRKYHVMPKPVRQCTAPWLPRAQNTPCYRWRHRGS